MEIIPLQADDTSRLSLFLSQLGEGKKTFRYYDKRPLSVIRQHLHTCLLLDQGNPVGYGHLDREEGVTWLGIAVIPPAQGKGWANQLMEHLLHTAGEKGVREICLTVDQDNPKAIQLYLKHGFVLKDEGPTYLRYKKTIPSSPKNILYFIPGIHKSQGGIYQYAMGLLNALQQSRHQIHILCYHPDPELLRMIRQASNFSLVVYSPWKRRLLFFLFKAQGGINRMANRLFKRRWVLGNAFLFGKMLQRYAIHVVHSPTQRLLDTKKCKTITTIHDVQQLHFPEFFSPAEKAYREVNYPVYMEKADAVVVSYQHVKEDLLRYYPIPESKIKVCLLDMGNLWFQGFSPEGIIPFSEPALLYPAATWPHKNHLNLIRALRKIKDRGITIKLLCTGHKTPYYETLTKEVEALGLEKQVSFLGIVENAELYELYQKVGAVIVPTLYEAGSFPLMESILMGIPVICSNVTSLPETIGDPDFVFDPHDVEEMGGKIEKILFDEAYRLRNKQILAQQAFSLKNNKIVQKIDHLYDTL